MVPVPPVLSSLSMFEGDAAPAPQAAAGRSIQVVDEAEAPNETSRKSSETQASLLV